MRIYFLLTLLLVPLLSISQAKFVYGVNGGIGISQAKFITPNSIAGLSAKKSNFVHFDFSADWLMGNNFRIGIEAALDQYKDKYRFDELEYLSVNHPDILKGLNSISKGYTKTNAFPVPSLSIVLSHEFIISNKIGLLPFLNYKFNYVPLYQDSLANQLNVGSNIVPDFAFNDWLYRQNEFNPSFVIGTKLRLYFSKKYLIQLRVGYEVLTENLKEGTLRINYLGKDSRERVRYRGNNFNITLGLSRYK